MNRWLSITSLSLSLFVSASAYAQRPGMPDPRRMSGISRVDGGLEAGAISVRALLGSFAEPAVDHEIRLELFSQAKKSLGSESSKSDGAGRVTFRQLRQRYPELAYAVASVTLDGVEEQTRPIVLSPQAGSRVLLVKGAGAMQAGGQGMPPAGMGRPALGAGSGPAHGAGGHGASGPGGLNAPALCRPNPMENQPPGTLVVGVIKFDAQGRLQGRAQQDVQLQVFVPGKPERIMHAVSDTNGRATFRDLIGEDYPEGTQFIVSSAASQNTPSPTAAAPSARVDTSVPVRSVRIRVFKPQATALVSERFTWSSQAKVVLLTRSCARAGKAAVTGKSVSLFRHSMSGGQSESKHALSAQGEVEVALSDHQDGDFYSVELVSQGAPFRSGFFQPPPHAGVLAELPIYEVSSDPSLLRSAVQFEFYSREDNMAQVNRFFQVFMPGNKAFWRPDFKIEGPEDTRWFKVVPAAESHLKHDEGAPFATLQRPVLPGQPVDLSVAYGVPHSGSLDLAWTAPFPLERALGVTSDELKIDSGAQAPSQQSQHQGSKNAAMAELNVGTPGPRGCQDSGASCEIGSKSATIKISVSGFAYERPWLTWAGGSLGGLALLGMGLGWWLGRREDPQVALMAQRDELWARLQRAESRGDEGEVKAVTAQLNALYHRMQALTAKQAPQ